MTLGCARWGAMVGMLLISGSVFGADVGALEKENPVKPLPAIPLGVERTFDRLENPPTPQSVRLGRWLFYDVRMSADNSISCATCHRPEHAFTEPTPVSTGIGGLKGGRKAPTFINQAWTLFPHFFWDGRAASLEEQAKGPLINPIEMGMPDHPQVVDKIGKIAGYKPYFKEVFGDDKVDIDRIAKAIADYERTRMSGNSPWDRWRAEPDPGDAEVAAARAAAIADPYADANAPLPQYKDGKHVSAKVKLGHELFFGKAGCNQCHLGPNFTDSRFHNLGVGWDPKEKKFADAGRHDVTKNPDDMGAFKTPTVREAALRAPFMHDGSVKTLREVMDLYNKGGEANPKLSPMIKPLNLTEEEINAVIAFMEALSGEGYQDTPPKLFPQ